MQQFIEWLKDYFSKDSELPEDAGSINYFEAGLIDSFGIILLVEAIEQEFGIQFTDTHFQDRRFSTINGLAEIINEIKMGLK